MVFGSASRRAFLASAFAAVSAQSAPKTRMIFGGDVIFDRGVAAKNKSTSPLRDIAELLRKADIAFVNLESPFSDEAPIWVASMVFRARSEYAEMLKDAGVDIVSTANNHSRDCGRRGLEFTLETLSKQGIAAVGTGKDEAEAYAGTVLERNGVQFGFLAYTFDQANGNHRDVDARIAMMDVKRMQQGIAALKKKCGAVIVSMHAGVEYAGKPHPQQTGFARAAIEAGAQLVVGHHPHVVQSFELYKGGLILYSLGNLVFDQVPPETNRGLLAEAVFEGPLLTEVDLIPVDIVDTVPRVSTKRARSTVRVRG